MNKTTPKAPKSLGRPGRALWAAIHSGHEVTDAEGIALATSVCRVEDDIQRQRDIVAADGDLMRDRWNRPMAHPLLQSIARLEVVKKQLLRALDLAPEQPVKKGRSLDVETT